jgi:N-6 DNA Methylase
MDKLGRYYTNLSVARLLISNLGVVNPQKIFDMGVGKAALTKAAKEMWGSAAFFGTDIEDKDLSLSKIIQSYLNYTRCNNLNPMSSAEILRTHGKMDLAICNPPYIKVKNKIEYSTLFRSIDCIDFSSIRIMSSEVVFFAQNISLLKSNGTLGIILSDSLISSKDYIFFRKVILERFEIIKIIQLPNRTFAKTEAKTHILILRKTRPVRRFVEIFEANTDGELMRKIDVLKSALINRMDFSYHSYNEDFALDSRCMTLSDIGAKVKRGKFTHKDLKAMNLPFFHTTTFKYLKDGRYKGESICEDYNKVSGHIGDIFLARVGSRIIGRTAKVEKGSILFSDCVYQITVSDEYQEPVFTSLRSMAGQKWLQNYARGVGSLVISKSDLMNFPINIEG